MMSVQHITKSKILVGYTVGDIIFFKTSFIQFFFYYYYSIDKMVLANCFFSFFKWLLV